MYLVVMSAVVMSDGHFHKVSSANSYWETISSYRAVPEQLQSSSRATVGQFESVSMTIANGQGGSEELRFQYGFSAGSMRFQIGFRAISEQFQSNFSAIVGQFESGSTTVLNG